MGWGVAPGEVYNNEAFSSVSMSIHQIPIFL